jgi:hypothetical protein
MDLGFIEHEEEEVGDGSDRENGLVGGGAPKEAGNFGIRVQVVVVIHWGRELLEVVGRARLARPEGSVQ